MPGGWGSSKNGIRIGVFWDGVQYNGDKSQARITDARIVIDRNVNINDSSNNLSWSGGAVTDGSDANINVDGSGEKRIKNVSAQWQDLSYTATTTAHFEASFSGVNYAGGTLTADKTVTFSKRPISIPAAPSALGVSGAGSSRTFNWTLTNTTAAPVATTELYRSLNDGAFLNVGSVAYPTASVTVSDLPDNSKIIYRFYTKNSAGESTGYVESAAIYTTPAAPSLAVATKLADGTINVSFQDNSAYETGFCIQDSPDGMSWADVVASTTNNPWNHTSPSTVVTHRYRVAALGPGGLQSGWSNTTNLIQLLAAPNAPTNLGPTSACSPAEAFALTWKHNPTDSSPQSSREIQGRTSTDGGATWSGWGALVTGASSTEAYTVAAGTFGAVRLEWQVRTKGQHADWSPWSSSSFLTLTPRPLTTIVSPGTTLNSSRMVVQLGYSDAGGYDQTSSTIRVFDTATEQQVLTQVSAGAVLPADFSATPLPEGVYRIEAWTSNSAGISSVVVTKTVTIEYLPPAVPEVVETAWNAEAGSLSIATSNAPGAGVTELARNLATNPSFESTSGTVVRRNAATVPTPVDGTGWTSSDLSKYPAVSAAGEGYRAGTGAKKFTRTTTSLDSVIASSYAVGINTWSVAERVPVVAGEVWTLSSYVKASVAFTSLIGVGFYDAANVKIGATINGAVFSGGAGTWVRPGITVTVPAGATNMGISNLSVSVATGVCVGGEIAWMTDALIEKVGAVLPFFSGAYNLDSDFTAAWTGTVNLSASTLTGVAVFNTSGESGLAISSQQWASTGTKSMRLIPTTTLNGTPMRVAGSDGALSGLGTTFEAGKTYTVTVKCRLAAPQAGTLAANARSLYVQYGAGSLTTYQGPQAPNAAGVYELRQTFTLPAGTDRCVVILMAGHSAGNGDVWWDDFAIVEGTYTGEFFDGSNTPDSSLDVAWTGTANGSASTLKTRATVDTVSQSLYRINPDGTRELVADLGVNDTALDETPVTSGPSYVLVAWSADGAAAENFFDVDPDEEVIRWFYLWKPGASARVRAALERKRSASLASTVSNYAGRPEAVSTYGEAIAESSHFNGVLLLAEGTDWSQIRTIVLTPGDAIVRTPDGLRFWANIPSTEATDRDLIYQQVSIPLVHVGA